MATISWEILQGKKVCPLVLPTATSHATRYSVMYHPGVGQLCGTSANYIYGLF